MHRWNKIQGCFGQPCHEYSDAVFISVLLDPDGAVSQHTY